MSGSGNLHPDGRARKEPPRTPRRKPPRILIVAGSDSSGGAGIQADIKTVAALGGYAATAITALTAQNTLGVADILPVPAAFVALQMRQVLGDIGADAIKTGMLLNAEIVVAVAEMLDTETVSVSLVVDPVMVSTSGRRLLDENGVSALRRLLLPRAALFTPNLPEAETLLGRPIASVDAMKQAAADLLAFGPGAVLLKGGHLAGEHATDILATPSGVLILVSPRIETGHNHGTGCTLASAAATFIGAGLDIVSAVEQARAFLRAALETAPGFGQGNGPLNHAHDIVHPAERPLR
jgi:hydroxymethylpyrimidine/phosphomethylpyrimidine kinase